MNKKIVTILGILTISGSVLAGKFKTNYMNLPRFIELKSKLTNNEDDLRVVDLVEVIKRSKIKNITILEKGQFFDKGFQDEKDDRDFVEFDDISVTVPLDIFKRVPINEGGF